MMILRILLVAILMTSTAMPALADLVGYWRFESDLTSEIGAPALDAIVGNGTPDPGTPGGQVGNCIHFDDADNEYIVLPVGFGTDVGTGASLGDSFSISVWYNLQPIEGNGSDRFFVYEGSSDYDLSYGVRDWDSDGDVDDGQSYCRNTAKEHHEHIDAATQNTWHHVLATYDSDGTDTTVTYWIDGVKQTPSMIQTSNSIGSPAIHVGDYRTGTSDRDWDGLIDEVAVWDHKLSDQEVSFVHTQGLNGQPIPEPSTLTLLVLAGITLGLFLSSRQKSILR
jgi:hypothetical protein